MFYYSYTFTQLKIFKQFAAQRDFKITTSSSQYPQSNGLFEQNVQNKKSLFKKVHNEEGNKDMTSLEFCNTSITGIEASQLVELLMSRRLRSSTMTGMVLKPDVLKGARTKISKIYHRQQNKRNSMIKEQGCNLI